MTVNEVIDLINDTSSWEEFETLMDDKINPWLKSYPDHPLRKDKLGQALVEIGLHLHSEYELIRAYRWQYVREVLGSFGIHRVNFHENYIETFAQEEDCYDFWRQLQKLIMKIFQTA